MSFPSDIKNTMRECLLSIFWPRQDILAFFRDYGCTSKDLKLIQNFKENNLSRAQMIDVVFDHLSSKPDGSLGQFRAMLKALLEWSHFDSYYFDKLKKLDHANAQRNLEHLRQLQEIRDAKIKEQRRRRETYEAESQKAERSLGELREYFLQLYFGSQIQSKQHRGYELEKILLDLAKLSDLKVTQSFRCNGEQIDGRIKYEGENYLVEAKWQEKEASNEPLYQFVGKVEGKMYGRGIFISIYGYSPHVVNSLVMGKAVKTILVDAEDLIHVLEESISFTEMLDKKIEAAQTKGLIDIHPLTQKPKER